MSDLSSAFDLKKPFLFGGVDYSVPIYIIHIPACFSLNNFSVSNLKS